MRGSELENPVVEITNRCEDIPVPEYESSHASGLDLRAAVDETITLLPGNRALVSTGIAIALPDGLEAQVRPRSGIAIRHGVTVLNSPGTIDADYRGEIKVILINHGNEPFVIDRGMRIAQMVIARVERCRLETVSELSDTERGTGGFGSSGTE